MKSVAVAGKGGTGKSTIAALIIERLVHRGLGPVLAVDADPDCNLGTLVGIKPEQTVGELRDEILKEIQDFPPGMTKANYIEAGLHGIIDEATGFDLITMGKGEGSGCYCYINSLIRKFCDDLAPSYKWMVMDNEAGLEHLSRRTTVDVDGLIVVATENPLSLHCAAQVEDITDGMKGRIRDQFVVTNMIREERQATVAERLSTLSMGILCNLPYNEKLEELIFNGESLGELNGEPLMGCIDSIIDRIGETMEVPDVATSWKSRINQVTIGATKDQGGTRGSTVTIGGQSALPFMSFEGDLPNKPVIAGYVANKVPEWPDVLKDAIGSEISSPVEWAQKAVEQFGVDLISLRLIGAAPTGGDASPADCAKVVEGILKAVDVPLVIWGSGDDEKDNSVMPEVSQVASGENCLLGSAKETNYMTIVAICKADKHKIISEAPVDINIGKQVNILLQDADFDLKDVVMFQTTAALGYGFDYVYTILERARTAGLQGDTLMAAPQLCDVGGEVWRIKEASVDEDILPGWGKLERRGPMWEAACAGNYLQAGADVLVMAHPEAIALTRTTIEQMG